jgi:hypothetical protein
VRRLVESAGQPCTYRDFPQVPHEMHQIDPKLFATTLLEWVDTLP